MKTNLHCSKDQQAIKDFITQKSELPLGKTDQRINQKLKGKFNERPNINGDNEATKNSPQGDVLFAHTLHR